MISFVIHRRPMGRMDAKSRNTRPRTMTVGPDSHTMFRTGGTFRSAISRSCQLLQKLSCFAIVVFGPESSTLSTRSGGYQPEKLNPREMPERPLRFDAAGTYRKQTFRNAPPATGPLKVFTLVYFNYHS